MGKSVPYVFLAVSLVFFLFLVGLTGYRIDTARKRNAASAAESASGLLEQAKALKNASSIDSPYFKQKMREIFTGETRLLLLTIHSESDGILYLIARNKSYVTQPRDLSPDWRGTPLYSYNHSYEGLFTVSFPAPDEALKMDALFVVLGREDLFPILRDDLYLLLGFLILCGIFILITFSMQEEEAKPVPSSIAVPPPAPGYSSPVPPRAEPSVPPYGGEAARSRPDSKTLASPDSGLVWGEYLEPRLKNEITRAASSDQDLSMALVELDASPADAGLPRLYNGVARLLKEIYPIHDLIFESGRSSMAMILPDMDIDQAVALCEEIRKKTAGSSFDGGSVTVSIGVSSRGGRLIEDATLMEEASVSVRKAAREGGNRVIGFRVDPAKYRETLSGLEGSGTPA
jgi:hypothetical protein